METMKPLLSTVEAVLFDLDGTLVETNIDFPLMKRRMLDLAADAGMDTKPLVGLDILAVVDSAIHFLSATGQHEEADDLRIRAMDTLEEIELRHARDTQKIPFAGELFEALEMAGVKTGIVTRNCQAASRVSLRIAGLKPDVLICREDSDKHKPHPEPVLLALTALGSRADASIMVGDHLMDIQSGKAAGLKTIGFLRDYRPPEFFDGVKPDLVARDLREVLHAIIDRDS